MSVLMVHICVCVFLHENGSGEGKKEDCSVLLVMQFRLNHNNSVILSLHNEVSEVGDTSFVTDKTFHVVRTFVRY